MQTTLGDLTTAIERDERARYQFKHLQARLNRWPTPDFPSTPEGTRMKAAVAAATTGGFPDYRNRTDAIVKLARTLLTQMGISPSPVNVLGYDVPVDPGGGFITETGPIPAGTLILPTVRTMIGRIGGIFGMSREIMRATDGKSQSDFQRAFTMALRRIENRELLSDTAPVAGQHPGGLLYTAPDLGTGSPGAIESDIEALFSFVSNGDPIRPFFITSPRGALWHALQRHENGARFPNVKINGGDIAGVPLLTSAAAGNKLILVDAGRLLITDEGLEITASDEAAIQLSDAPSAGATNLVSAFQTDTTFVRLQRYVGWVKAGDDVIAYAELSELAGSPD
jgi:hypothetical protein